MLSWAFRYLGVAVVVGVAFASLQDGDGPGWLAEWASKARVANDKARVADGPARRPRGQSARPADPEVEPEGEHELEHVVAAGPDGHYVIDAMVDGAPLTFLIDTGASEIVLTVADARRIGLDPRTLDYTQRFQTANGEVRGAPVTLRELRIGQLQLYDLPASVNEAPLGISLLGMSFLQQLQSYEVRDDRLVLRW